jgi:hypothetical protein
MEVRREFEHVTVIYEQLAARLNQIRSNKFSCKKTRWSFVGCKARSNRSFRSAWRKLSLTVLWASSLAPGTPCCSLQARRARIKQYLQKEKKRGQ